MCFGGYSEASDGVWELLTHMSNSRLQSVGLARGRPGSDQELAVITGQLRRRLSLAVVRANTTCLIERMAMVGGGSTIAGRRRQQLRMEEERMRGEREAHWMARVTGSSLIRRGQFLLGW